MYKKGKLLTESKIRVWLLNNHLRYPSRSKAISECMRMLKVNERTVRRWMRRLEDEGLISRKGVMKEKLEQPEDSPPMDDFEEETIIKTEENFAALELISKAPHNVEELIAISGLDSKLWEIRQGRINFWGNEHYPCWQTRAEFTRKVSEGGESFLKELKEAIQEFAPLYPTLDYKHRPQPTGEGYMLEVSVYDPHLGVLLDTVNGCEETNVDTTATQFYTAVSKILWAYRDYPITQILFVVGNDFFATNNSEGTTKKGTPQEADPRWKRTYRKGFDTLVASIDLCQTIAPVQVVAIAGNHDEDKIFYLAHALEAWYFKCENVVVDNSAKPYKFVKFGKNLLGFNHGRDIKAKELPLLMATEAKEAWSECEYYEWHLGDKHHLCTWEFLSAAESNGVRVRIMPSLCSRDFWHTMKGYGAMKEAVGLLWDAEEGNVCAYNFHVGRTT